MPKGMNAGPKDPFENLSPEFKEAIDGSDRDQIKARITQVFRDEAENQRNKREDLHVQEEKLKVEKLSAPYKQRKGEAKLAAKIAAHKGLDSDATDAAILLAEIEQEESTDNDLVAAKDSFSDAASRYTDATKENNLKIKYCLYMINNKGGVTSPSLKAAIQGLKDAVPGATLTFSAGGVETVIK